MCYKAYTAAGHVIIEEEDGRGSWLNGTHEQARACVCLCLQREVHGSLVILLTNNTMVTIIRRKMMTDYSTLRGLLRTNMRSNNFFDEIDSFVCILMQGRR